ncbi:MgtC/SapB family protein [Paenibacillus radicibacter]|uniref:MgtC/SapB family protein n=1 Tax=Paenibacillus radicibacter TaxID=2972488 RepID=UPI00215925A8|nr:MgtC/SapB family protein [Paenibacillus radicibacter]
MMLKLSLALLFGLLIGIDRQIKQKQLGLRPSMVICIASCLLTIVSIEAFGKFAGENHPNMDPMRLAAQIVSGVGFIGAGVILRKHNDVISGLTSAALVWSASALGITIGVGFYLEAICGVVLIILAVNFVPFLIKMLGPERLNREEVAVKIKVEPNTKMTQIIKRIEHKHTVGNDLWVEYKIRDLKIKDLTDGTQLIELTLTVPKTHYTTDIYYDIKQIEHVLTVEVEHL